MKGADSARLLKEIGKKKKRGEDCDESPLIKEMKA
jgi:hypothetical protein